ncbi:hypothetical protein C9374_006062 [Naegleria lovaniensis]|uniref:Uncharacterized protein n=1 Tax=Naegleria lovaniensis TaxID=51637 RepID=A0AA88KJC4_NAELO|nr:uncharacterized protein C9374_006062 [Naegleria lovaniensis]KAG2381678.1 hypothetical protein C9374_006062 [Naegleria lovaniensis]
MKSSVFAIFIMVALTAVLMITSSASKVKALSIPKELPSNVLAFVEGFLLGIEADVGNVTACTRDATITLNDFDNAFYSLEYGFKKMSPQLIETGLQELAAGIEEIKQGIEDCNIKGIIKQIESLIAQLKSGTLGVVKVLVHEAINIFHNGQNITTEFKNAIQYWKDKKYELCGVQVGMIVGVLLE